jgi:hypothetical protein
MKTKLFAFFAIALAAIAPLFAQAPQKSVKVTVYNDNLGVVREVREIDLQKGISDVKIVNVPSMIDPTSVHIDLDGQVLEQNYQYDLVSLQKILEKYVDYKVSLIGEDGATITGKLLSISGNSIVLETEKDGLVMLPEVDDYKINVADLPEGLITRPTLVWKVLSNKTAKKDAELTYQTGGMNWHAEYVVLLDKEDKNASVNSWVSVDNRSGASFKDAELKLIAGEVNRVLGSGDAWNIRGGRSDANQIRIADLVSMEERSFFEYHIYEMQRKNGHRQQRNQADFSF